MKHVLFSGNYKVHEHLTWCSDRKGLIGSAVTLFVFVCVQVLSRFYGFTTPLGSMKAYLVHIGAGCRPCHVLSALRIRCEFSPTDGQ